MSKQISKCNNCGRMSFGTKRDKYCASCWPHGEIDKLRSVNAQLAEALKKAVVMCRDGRVSYSLITKEYMQKIEDVGEAALAAAKEVMER